jgi:MFS family permease
MILAVLFAARAAIGFQFQSVGSAAKMLMEDLGMDYSQIGMLMGAYLLPGVIVAFPAGLLGQRFDALFRTLPQEAHNALDRPRRRVNQTAQPFGARRGMSGCSEVRTQFAQEQSLITVAMHHQRFDQRQTRHDQSPV